MVVFPASEVSIEKETSLCITGHRERSITPYQNNPDFYDATVMTVKLMLSRYIDIVMNKGYSTMINGLAEGTDLWAASYCLKRKRFAKTSLIGVMPFLRHADFLAKSYRDTLFMVERYADKLITTCDVPNITYSRRHIPGTSSLLYQNRNQFMVDNSSVVVAFFDGKNCSGTAQTIRYAQRRNKPVFSFGMKEVFGIMDEAGTERDSIIKKLADIRFAVPKPDSPTSIIPQLTNISSTKIHKID